MTSHVQMTGHRGLVAFFAKCVAYRVFARRRLCIPSNSRSYLHHKARGLLDTRYVALPAFNCNLSAKGDSACVQWVFSSCRQEHLHGVETSLADVFTFVSRAKWQVTAWESAVSGIHVTLRWAHTKGPLGASTHNKIFHTRTRCIASYTNIVVKCSMLDVYFWNMNYS